MSSSQLLTLIFGLGLAALAVGWAVREARRDSTRYPLIRGLDPRLVLLGLAWFLPFSAVAYVVFKNELVPKDSPGLFALTLGWMSAAVIAAMLATTILAQRRLALGWLTLVGPATLRLEIGETVREQDLEPGCVRAFFVAGLPGQVRFEIAGPDGSFFLCAQVPIYAMRGLVTEGRVVPPEGLTLGAGVVRFCEWVRPFIVQDTGL